MTPKQRREIVRALQTPGVPEQYAEVNARLAADYEEQIRRPPPRTKNGRAAAEAIGRRMQFS